MPVCKLATNLEIWPIAEVTFDSKTIYHKHFGYTDVALPGEAMNITASTILHAAHRLCDSGRGGPEPRSPGCGTKSLVGRKRRKNMIALSSDKKTSLLRSSKARPCP